MNNEAVKMMVNKLKIEADNGRIENDWVVEFVYEMWFRVKQDAPLSEKQKAKIEELFEKY